MDESRKEKVHIGLLIILSTLLMIVIILRIKYRFSHPEMTETQLMLHFFDAFKDF